MLKELGEKEDQKKVGDVMAENDMQWVGVSEEDKYFFSSYILWLVPIVLYYIKLPIIFICNNKIKVNF